MSYSAYHIGSAHFLHNKSLAVLLFLNSALVQCLMLVVLGNPILPRLYHSPKQSEQDVSSVVIHYRKFFTNLNTFAGLSLALVHSSTNMLKSVWVSDF